MQMIPTIAAAFENFTFDSPLFTLETVVWGLVIGVCVGAAWSVLTRRTLGTFVKRMHAAGAGDPDTAVTLENIGMAKNPILKVSLREGKALRKYALCANPEESVIARPAPTGFGKTVRRILSLEETRPAQVDLSRARFYMPDEQRYEAEVRYDKKGTDIAGLIVSVVLLIVLGFVVQWLLPELLAYLDRAISAMR